jgi:hypothetical protein
MSIWKLQSGGDNLIILFIVPFRTMHPSVPQFCPVLFCSVGSTFLIPNILILIVGCGVEKLGQRCMGGGILLWFLMDVPEPNSKL